MALYSGNFFPNRNLISLDLLMAPCRSRARRDAGGGGGGGFYPEGFSCSQHRQSQ